MSSHGTSLAIAIVGAQLGQAGAMHNRITYELSGRLGNQLQLYAGARTLSLRYGFTFIYNPLSLHEQLNLRHVYGPSYKSRLAYLATRFTSRARRLHTIPLDHHRWDETYNDTGVMGRSYLARTRALFLLRWGGIFKRIHQYIDVLREEIVPPHLRRLPVRRSIGMHIRRDDSLYKLPLDYYVQAAHAATRSGDCEPVIQLYSDGDHEQLAAKLSERLPHHRIEIERGSAVEDLMSLSRHTHMIISKSWFSYWSACLSTSGARVFCPPSYRYYEHWTPIDHRS